LDLKADISVAAIYLGRKVYVGLPMIEGTQFCSTAERRDIYSSDFGYVFKQAAI
jgi:hypothetical protein